MSTRSSLGSNGRFYGSNILPTPDPTIASCISDEDVALQLMRLGDASNFSHGRTSASTLDDAFSGRADAASSVTSNSDDGTDATEQPALPISRPQLKVEPDTEQLGPPLKKQCRHLNDNLHSIDSTEPSGDEVDGDYQDTVAQNGEEEHDHKPKTKGPRTKKAHSGSALNKTQKAPKPFLAGNKKSKLAALPSGFHPPMSPSSLPPQSRKTSMASTINFSAHGLNGEEDDLSSKPRCQRCRKSKKGCDRQRPCQRCKDAGIGIEGCISEDENNGRKGRYGRHMGIAVVKKSGDAMSVDNESVDASVILSGMASAAASPDKGKKRKR